MASERVRAQTSNSNITGVRMYIKVDFVNVIEDVWKGGPKKVKVLYMKHLQYDEYNPE